MTRISLRLGLGVFQDSIVIFFFIITDYVTFADSDYCITLNTCLPIRIRWLNYKIRPQYTRVRSYCTMCKRLGKEPTTWGAMMASAKKKKKI